MEHELRRKTDNAPCAQVLEGTWRDKVICEHPLVTLAMAPRLMDYELVPGFVKSRWEALAKVDGCYARIEVTVTRMEKPA